MQDAAVFPATDNRVVGREARTVTVKFVMDFPFKLVLEHAGTALFHCAGMRQGADFARAAQHIEFFFRLEQAHLMHHRTPVRERCGRRQILARTFTQLIQRGENNLIRIRVFALRVVEHVQTVQQLIKLLVNFAKGQRAVHA